MYSVPLLRAAIFVRATYYKIVVDHRKEASWGGTHGNAFQISSIFMFHIQVFILSMKPQLNKKMGSWCALVRIPYFGGLKEFAKNISCKLGAQLNPKQVANQSLLGIVSESGFSWNYTPKN